MSVQTNIYTILQEDSPGGIMARGAVFATGSAVVLGGLLAGKGVAVLVGIGGVAMGVIGWMATVGVVVGLAILIFGAMEARKEKTIEEPVEQGAQNKHFISRVERLANFVQVNSPVLEVALDSLSPGEQAVARLFASAYEENFEELSRNVEAIHQQLALSNNSMATLLTQAIALLPEGPSEAREYLNKQLNAI